MTRKKKEKCSITRLHPPTQPSCYWVLIVIALSLPPPGLGQTKKSGAPEKNPPPCITRLTGFGERAAWSPDGRRIAFMSKSFGDAFEIDLETKIDRKSTRLN